MGMREEFEAAIIAEFKSVGIEGGPNLCRNNNNGDYLNQVVGGAWWAWQASRATLVVELPKVTYKQNPDPETDVEVRIRNEMRVQLTDAGVSYK